MTKRLKSKWNWARARAPLAVALGVGTAPLAEAQQLEGHLRLNGSQVMEAFEPIRAVLQQSSVVLYDGRKTMGYGVVVSSDGYLVAKASELEKIKKLSVRIDKTEYKSVKVLASTAEWDVALLKVEAEDLVPVEWSEDAEPAHGTWVVSNGSSSRLRRRVRIGIISANAREVGGGKSPVVLGVQLNNEKENLSIREVAENSGAAAAGLKSGDVILSADGQEVAKIEDLQEILSKKEPGDKVKLRVERDGEQKEFEVELRAREKIFEEKESRNQAMSGRVSQRRTNFKRILQHDVMLSERSTGGPLLNLDGRCVGMNIARADRAESYAIPAAEMVKVIKKLREESK